MLEIKVNGILYKVEEDTGVVKVNGRLASFDLEKIDKDKWHMIKDNKSYNLELVDNDEKNRKITVKVNGTKYKLEIKDQYDLLLEKLGMASLNSGKVNNIKAPMPGLVLDIFVKKGQTIRKGEGLLIIEAMKMENLLKSPCEGVVKKVIAQKKGKVEKNQVLVEFE